MAEYTRYPDRQIRPAPATRGGEPDDAPGPVFDIDCATCVASNTTACNDCIVGHVLANDSGPIDLLVVEAGSAGADPADPIDAAVERFVAAGLCGDEPWFVSVDDFELAHVDHRLPSPS